MQSAMYTWNARSKWYTPTCSHVSILSTICMQLKLYVLLDLSKLRFSCLYFHVICKKYNTQNFLPHFLLLLFCFVCCCCCCFVCFVFSGGLTTFFCAWRTKLKLSHLTAVSVYSYIGQAINSFILSWSILLIGPWKAQSRQYFRDLQILNALDSRYHFQKWPSLWGTCFPCPVTNYLFIFTQNKSLNSDDFSWMNTCSTVTKSSIHF